MTVVRGAITRSPRFFILYFANVLCYDFLMKLTRDFVVMYASINENSDTTMLDLEARPPDALDNYSNESLNVTIPVPLFSEWGLSLEQKKVGLLIHCKVTSEPLNEGMISDGSILLRSFTNRDDRFTIELKDGRMVEVATQERKVFFSTSLWIHKDGKLTYKPYTGDTGPFFNVGVGLSIEEYDELEKMGTNQAFRMVMTISHPGSHG
jgi:hypothetical protein